MAFEIEYFHERVLAEIESWPVDVLADYARLAEFANRAWPKPSAATLARLRRWLV